MSGKDSSILSEWTNRESQKLFMVVVLFISIMYMSHVHWFPLLLGKINIWKQKRKILEQLKQSSNNVDSAVIENDRILTNNNPLGKKTSNKAFISPTFELKSNNVTNISRGNDIKSSSAVLNDMLVNSTPEKEFKLKSSSMSASHSNKQDSEQTLTDLSQSTNITNSENKIIVRSHSSTDNTTVPSEVPTVNPSHYAPLPVRSVSGPERLLEQERKLKRQQDREFARSVEADIKKHRREQIALNLVAEKQVRLENIRQNPRVIEHMSFLNMRMFNISQAEPTGEGVIKLSFRYNTKPTLTTLNVNTQNHTHPPNISKIVNGDILNSKVVLKKITGVFSVHDTIEYVMDFVESNEDIMRNSNLNVTASGTTTVCNDIFELSLSYPTRVLNRAMDPALTLKDVNVTTDSVVWVCFKDM